MKRLANLIALIILAYSTAGLALSKITDYRQVFLPVSQEKHQLMIAIRTFNLNGNATYLVVDPVNLTTHITSIQKVTSQPDADIKNTRYYQLLDRYTDPPYSLENKGVKHINTLVNSNILTVDLCPSSRHFEQQFFQKLVDLSAIHNKPTPVTIAISGRWLIKHPTDFNWLLDMQRSRKLDITWANHSYSHPYKKDWPYSHNFLLSPNINLSKEILLTEKYLIEAGEMPSVLFRFPGLVSNKLLIEAIKTYGLIPLSADAWIAKDEPITNGGIILVHGNGNEHEGIERLMPLLDKLQFLGLLEALRYHDTTQQEPPPL